MDKRLLEAAERLGVSPRAIRLRITGGALPAVKLGRDWRVDERELARLARRHPGIGRPLSPAMAWAVLLLASGDEPTADRLVGVRVTGRELGSGCGSTRWVTTPPGFGSGLVVRCSRRTRPSSPGCATGHAPIDDREAIVAKHALMSGSGGVTVRWVPDDVWAALDQAGHVAPRAAVLIDLLESDDPRARREAALALTP